MTTSATLRSGSDEGWGVLDSEETPGGCLAHFSSAGMRSPEELPLGQKVWLDWEASSQDGYKYRAVRFWPQGSEPLERSSAGSSDLYGSELNISFDTE
jgi:CspA family cold shock protein